jgi:hypothetical protein
MFCALVDPLPIRPLTMSASYQMPCPTPPSKKHLWHAVELTTSSMLMIAIHTATSQLFRRIHVGLLHWRQCRSQWSYLYNLRWGLHAYQRKWQSTIDWDWKDCHDLDVCKPYLSFTTDGITSTVTLACQLLLFSCSWNPVCRHLGYVSGL